MPYYKTCVVTAFCDNCEEATEEKEAGDFLTCIRYLRQGGWRLGSKKTLCPKCNKRSVEVEEKGNQDEF
jgi:hypothetical protein